MPAASKTQQRLMGMVYSYKKGELNTSSIDPELLSKIKKIADGIKSKSAKKFAKTKHKGLPEVKESQKLTFKDYLVEMSMKEREALTPPPAVTKLYKQIKQKYGLVKRDVFMNALADRLNLTPDGLKKLQALPALQALPFDDVEDKPIATRTDPWSHVSQKAQRRDDRFRQAGITEGADLYCPECGENLGKSTENYKKAYCGRCGEENIPNPRGHDPE